MEKEVVWTSTAQRDFWNHIYYLAENWPIEVLQKFEFNLDIKVQLISRLPNIGFSSKKYSRFKKTLVGKHVVIIYAVKKTHIVIHKLKHAGMK